MIVSKYQQIDTPALLIDNAILKNNLKFIQNKANEYNVKLRPHTKTHKMPEIAKMQIEEGACGIAVAKTDEAVVMANNGIDDIFIANQIIGKLKLEKIKDLNNRINISIGIDSIEAVEQIDEVFSNEEKKLDVLIEIEVGERRSGIIEESDMRALVNKILNSKHVNLKGIYSHDGNTYKAPSREECIEISIEAQKRTLRFAEIAREEGAEIQVVSIGSTPSVMLGEIIKGVTEIRIGTYVFMDTAQGNAIGTYERCAASVLTTVISKPTEDRVITDSGAKALTAQTRPTGICKTTGLGYIKGSDKVYLDGVFDEHGIFYNKELRESLKIGDKIEIIPNHICPVVNLYDEAYLVENGNVIKTLEIKARGKIK